MGDDRTSGPDSDGKAPSGSGPPTSDRSISSGRPGSADRPCRETVSLRYREAAQRSKPVNERTDIVIGPELSRAERPRGRAGRSARYLTPFFPSAGARSDDVDTIEPLHAVNFEPVLSRNQLANSETRRQGTGLDVLELSTLRMPRKAKVESGSEHAADAASNKDEAASRAVEEGSAESHERDSKHDDIEKRGGAGGESTASSWDHDQSMGHMVDTDA